MAHSSSTKNSGRITARVLIIDDHPIVRKGLGEVINNEKDLELCGEANDIEEALAEIKNAPPDIALVDLSLDDQSGLELIKQLRIEYPDLPVLVISMHDESLYAERALRAGARGYVMKKEKVDTIIHAIRKVLQGHIYLSDAMVSKLLNVLVDGAISQSETRVTSLSDRELEVFRLIGMGFGTGEIAKKLHLSVKTIETYRAHIKSKLNLKNAAELVHHAISWAQENKTC